MLSSLINKGRYIINNFNLSSLLKSINYNKNIKVKRDLEMNNNYDEVVININSLMKHIDEFKYKNIKYDFYEAVLFNFDKVVSLNNDEWWNCGPVYIKETSEKLYLHLKSNLVFDSNKDIVGRLFVIEDGIYLFYLENLPNYQEIIDWFNKCKSI
jgi:hypothetical protein